MRDTWRVQYIKDRACSQGRSGRGTGRGESAKEKNYTETGNRVPHTTGWEEEHKEGGEREEN